MDMSQETNSKQQNWLNLLKCARETDEQNLEVMRGPDKKLQVRSTRNISPGDVLGLWFSKSLEKEMGFEGTKHDKKQGKLRFFMSRLC